MDSTSPSLMTTPPGAVSRPARVSTSSSSAPQTQVLPIPRATTAAWLVLPPRLVRMPLAAIIPCRSSGFVSRRTRMTASPAAARSTALAESNTALPTAAPGEALTPVVIFFGSVAEVEPGEHQLGELVAGDPGERLVHVDQALVHELGGDAERGARGALAHPGLQHPELAALDGELDVAQVLVVVLQGLA